MARQNQQVRAIALQQSNENNDVDCVIGQKPSPKGPSPNSTGTRYTYRDYSKELPPAIVFTGGVGGHDHIDPSAYIATPPGIKLQKLPTKLDAMLSDPSCQGIITWMPHGRAWKVLRPKEFVSHVIPRYFENTNYNSFVRLVNAWGFRRFSTGPDRHAYFHELFLRGKPHLHIQMRRLSRHETKTPLDSKDEPDLYALEALQDASPPQQGSTSAEASFFRTCIQSNLPPRARRIPNPNEPCIQTHAMTQAVEFKNLPRPSSYGSFPPSLNTLVQEPRRLSQLSFKQLPKPLRPSEQAWAHQSRIDHMKQFQHDLLVLEEEEQAQEQVHASHEASSMKSKMAQLPPHLKQAQLELERREEALRMERARLDLEAQRMELHKKEQQMQALRRDAQQGKLPLKKPPSRLTGAIQSTPGRLPYNRDMVMGKLRAHFFGIGGIGQLEVSDPRPRVGYYSREA